MPLRLFKKICAEVDPDITKHAPSGSLSIACRALKDALGVEHEYQILQHPKVLSIVDDCVADEHLRTLYKPAGSWSTVPLTNSQIDDTIHQWERGFPDMLDIEMNMIDFADYGGTLEQLISSVDELARGRPVILTMPETHRQLTNATPKHIFCCVLNSDSLGGPGKHWTAIFMDFSKPQGTIEFFNSSGNQPYPEVVMWQSRMINSVMKHGICNDVEFVQVSNIKHQRGPTECGVYCLFYLWSRLNGTSYEHFKKHEIRDEVVTKFRQSHLFLPP